MENNKQIKLNETIPEKNAKVGVYGTLKEGFSLHFYLEGQKRFPNKILTGFKMYRLGWYPGVVPNSTEEEQEKLEVEVYEIPPSLLSQLDKVEGIPHLYRRYQVEDMFLYVYNGEPHGERIRVKDNVWRQ